MPLDKLPAIQVPPSPPPAPLVAREVKKEHHSVGPTVGIVIIVILLLAGALYFWGKQLNNQAKNPPAFIPGDRIAQ